MALATLRAEVDRLRAEVQARTAVRCPLARPPLAEWAAKYLTAKTSAGLSPLRPESELHRWLCAEMDRLRQVRGVRLCVQAPRGSAKTTWATLAHPLRAALYGDEKYIVLTSDTGAQAQAYLGDLRELLESNEALLRDYPAAAGRGPLWRGDAIRLRNGVEVAAFGTGGKIRGRKARGLYRPGLIVVDDPQNKDHVISPLMRERSWDWLTRDVLNAGDPETNIVVLGTALHRESIVCRLQKTPGWRTKVFKSIGQMPARTDLWKEWESILHDHDDPLKEEKAKRFYLEGKEEMDA